MNIESSASMNRLTIAGRQIANLRIHAWEFGGVFFIVLMGSALHYAFELSGFWRPMAFFASVNESTWEHLKFFFWAGLAFSLLEYTYVKDVANNYWFGKALSLVVTPIVVAATFYGYLAIALPIYGKGFLWADISTGVVGVIAGQLVSSKLMRSEPLGQVTRRYTAVILLTLLFMFSTFTYFPPKMFLFENYFGYTYSGEYGILADYEPYLQFRPAEEQ